MVKKQKTTHAETRANAARKEENLEEGTHGDAQDTARSSSGSSDDASADLSEDGEDHEVPADVVWLLPAGPRTGARATMLHLASGIEDEHGRPIPMCRRRAFVWGCQIGRGLAAAEATGLQWHSRCYRSE